MQQMSFIKPYQAPSETITSSQSMIHQQPIIPYSRPSITASEQREVGQFIGQTEQRRIVNESYQQSIYLSRHHQQQQRESSSPSSDDQAMFQPLRQPRQISTEEKERIMQRAAEGRRASAERQDFDQLCRRQSNQDHVAALGASGTNSAWFDQPKQAGGNFVSTMGRTQPISTFHTTMQQMMLPSTRQMMMAAASPDPVPRYQQQHHIRPTSSVSNVSNISTNGLRNRKADFMSSVIEQGRAKIDVGRLVKEQRALEAVEAGEEPRSPEVELSRQRDNVYNQSMSKSPIRSRIPHPAEIELASIELPNVMRQNERRRAETGAGSEPVHVRRFNASSTQQSNYRPITPNDDHENRIQTIDQQRFQIVDQRYHDFRSANENKVNLRPSEEINLVDNYRHQDTQPPKNLALERQVFSSPSEVHLDADPAPVHLEKQEISILNQMQSKFDDNQNNQPDEEQQTEHHVSIMNAFEETRRQMTPLEMRRMTYADKPKVGSRVFRDLSNDPLHREFEKVGPLTFDMLLLDEPVEHKDFTKQLVAEYLVRLIHIEEEKQEMKCAFFACISSHNTSHTQLFQRLDRARKGYLTYNDLHDLFVDLGRSNENTSADMRMLVKDKKLSFSRFLKLVMDLEALRKKEVKGSNLLKMPNDSEVVRKIDRLHKDVENGLADLLLSLVTQKKDEKFLQKELKKRKDFHLKQVFFDLLQLAEIDRENLRQYKFDKSQMEGVDTLALQRFMLKHLGRLIDHARISNLLQRRIFKLRCQKNNFVINLHQFCKLFSHKSVIVSTSGHGIAHPSRWNAPQSAIVRQSKRMASFHSQDKSRRRSDAQARTNSNCGLRFKPAGRELNNRFDEQRLSQSFTKSFQKPYLSRKEERDAFQQYMQCKLALDQRCEDAKINLIADEFFVSPQKAFQMLAGQPKNDSDDVLASQDLASEITAKQILQLLKQADAEYCGEMCLADVESFLYCIQKPLTYSHFKQLMWPNSNDFAAIIGKKEIQYNAQLSRKVHAQAEQHLSDYDRLPGKSASILAYEKLEEQEFPDSHKLAGFKHSMDSIDYDKLQKQVEVYQESQGRDALARFLRSQIVLSRKQIEARREYLRGMRYQDLCQTHFNRSQYVKSGASAGQPNGGGADYDDLLHFERDFLALITRDFYPFRGNAYMVGKRFDVEASARQKAKSLKQYLCNELSLSDTKALNWFISDLTTSYI